jgi:hypothetical protein
MYIYICLKIFRTIRRRPGMTRGRRIALVVALITINRLVDPLARPAGWMTRKLCRPLRQSDRQRHVVRSRRCHALGVARDLSCSRAVHLYAAIPQIRRKRRTLKEALMNRVWISDIRGALTFEII